MLRFKLHQFHLGKTYYVLLPKLNLVQMQVLAERLKKMGELVGSSGLLSARTRKGTFHIAPSGLCWSRTDPADVILPVVPDLLSCPKTKISQKELESKYFVASEAYGASDLRLLTRLESGPTWKALRSSGECALTPDESRVAIHLMKYAREECRILADFPMPESTERVFGRRHYFDSTLRCLEVGVALRTAGSKRVRNVYLPQGAVLRMQGTARGSPKESQDLLNGLGDWCFYCSA